jgi:outer membrane protein assembly factor BamB
VKAHSLLSRVAVSLLLLCATARADWPQYRGPSQNGVSAEKAFNAAAANAPAVLWKANVGKGISSVTVLGGRAYTMGNTNGTDNVYCFDAKSGRELWRQQFTVSLDPKLFEGGPRSTPSVDGTRVYILSHTGDLRCLDAANGRKIWERNLVREFGGRRPDWGYSGSPLLTGSVVICDAGGPGASTVALDKLTGSVVWKSGSDEPGYATPVLAELAGQATVVSFRAAALVGCEPKSGKELWRFPWKTSYDINAATPLVIGADKIFISSGYNTGCALVQIARGQANQLWRNKNLRAHFNSPVTANGSIFGIDGNAGGGNLVCLETATGARRWEEKSVKGGAMILADGKLIILTEKGELVICEASPAGFRPLSRSRVLEHRCWAQPTLDAGRLFLRNNEGDLVCLDVSAK